MGKLYLGKIELTKVNKEKLFKSEKSGRIYADVKIWVNDDDDVDNYGNQVSIQQATEKDEDNIYLGNAKLYKKGEGNESVQNAEIKDDDLPF